MLLENPSTYLAFVESTWRETAFIAEIVQRTDAVFCWTLTIFMSPAPTRSGGSGGLT